MDEVGYPVRELVRTKFGLFAWNTYNLEQCVASRARSLPLSMTQLVCESCAIAREAQPAAPS